MSRISTPARAGRAGIIVMRSFRPLPSRIRISRFAGDFSDSRRLVVFPAAGVVCGLVPMIGLAAVWGGQHLFSPEAVLFGVLFCGANAAFGFGYAVLLPWVHP